MTRHEADGCTEQTAADNEENESELRNQRNLRGDVNIGRVATHPTEPANGDRILREQPGTSRQGKKAAEGYCDPADHGSHASHIRWSALGQVAR